MTINDAAKLLGLAPSTLRDAIRKGTMRAEKHGRDHWIVPAEVERYRRERQGKRGRPRKEPTQ